MIKKDINQNDILNSELLNIIDYNYIFDENPIKRIKTKPTLENSKSRLKSLENKIKAIENCNLKKNASKIVFSDGNMQSPIMIVGEGPGQKEDELGKPFVGDAGNLLNKPPNNRKPEPNEINRYSEFLKEHVSIIDPKILILMGSTAMEAILGSNKRISKERGQWKEVIIKQKNYKTIVTFHPAYLLRKPDQKKFSWEDLKIIRIEIDQQNISI